MSTFVNCDECTFWDTSTKAHDDDDDSTGLCRRASPQIDWHTGRGNWPITENSDSCGDGMLDLSEAAR